MDPRYIIARPSAATPSSSRREIVYGPSSSSSRTRPTQSTRPRIGTQEHNSSAFADPVQRLAMTVGCEIETNLRARHSRDDICQFGEGRYGWGGFASNVCRTFNENMSEHRQSVRMRVKGDPRHPVEYCLSLWTLERDGSIRKDRNQQVSIHQVSIEIVSPIMLCDAESMWREEVESMYRHIGSDFYFEANESCGLHVHMKPSTRWDMTELRALCKAIVYFDRTIQILLPSHRASANIFCKQNYSENPRLRSLDLGACFDKINGTRGLGDLKELMNADGEGGSTRYYAWNFTNLEFDPQKHGFSETVEYRNPPHANDVRTCKAWMTFAMTFAGAARRVAREDAKIRREFDRDLRGLMSFLEYGSERWTRKSEYLSLFPGGGSSPARVAVAGPSSFRTSTNPREAPGSSIPPGARVVTFGPSSSRTNAPSEVRRSQNGQLRMERRRNY